MSVINRSVNPKAWAKMRALYGYSVVPWNRSGPGLHPQIIPVNSWTLDVSALTVGIRYYWSVQAIDTSFAGGAWAPEATFLLLPANLDADHDGMDFLAETFMGFDPNVSESTYPLFEVGNTADQWVFTFQQAHDTKGVTATILWSTDLQNWQSTGITVEQGIDLGTAWEMRAYLPNDNYDTVFFRLLIKD